MTMEIYKVFNLIKVSRMQLKEKLNSVMITFRQKDRFKITTIMKFQKKGTILI